MRKIFFLLCGAFVLTLFSRELPIPVDLKDWRVSEKKWVRADKEIKLSKHSLENAFSSFCL